MDLEQLYYLGELVGVAAVVASLLFVGVQMRQNTRAIRNSSAQAMVASWGDSNRDIFSDPNMSQLFTRLRTEQLGLPDGEDGLRALLWFNNSIRQAELSYYNWINGNLEERFWDQARWGLSGIFSMRAGQQAWEQVRLSHGQEFRDLVDQLATQTDAS